MVQNVNNGWLGINYTTIQTLSFIIMNKLKCSVSFIYFYSIFNALEKYFTVLFTYFGLLYLFLA